MIFVWIAVVWLVCAVFHAGMYFAYMQGEFPTLAETAREEDLKNGWKLGLFGGPIAAVAACAFGLFKHGWRLR